MILGRVKSRGRGRTKGHGAGELCWGVVKSNTECDVRSLARVWPEQHIQYCIPKALDMWHHILPQKCIYTWDNKKCPD